MMGIDVGRSRAVVRKELQDYRRRRAIVVAMVVLPILFLVEPVVTIFVSPVASGSGLHTYVIFPLLYLLLIPTVMPSTLAAYSVTGEREQGTLEPLLTTPIRRQELIVGKAASVMLPTLVLSYTVFGLFLAAVALFAHPAVASAVFGQGPVLLALFLFAPLVAGWAIVVGMAVSVRVNEMRVAQQLAVLASLPIIGVVVLLAAGVFRPTFPVAVEFAVGLVAIDGVALRLVARLFDRERLVTGARASTPKRTRPAAGSAATSAASSFALQGSSTGGATIPASATVAVSRRWGGLVGGSQDWQVVIDGDVAGIIVGQGSVELPVEPGRHTLRLRSERHASAERSFDAADGQVVRFSCRGAVGWPVYLAALVKPDLWISLRQVRA